MPPAGLNAQSNTGKCSTFNPGAPSIVSLSSMCFRIASIESASYPSFSSPSFTVRLTIFNIPPPASCLYLTKAMSGSIPVVSQSIMKLMVPVGANTVAWAFRNPNFSPSSSTSSQSLAAAVLRSEGPASSIWSHASRCIFMTANISLRLSSKPSKLPTTDANSALVRFASPCSSDVTEPQ